MATTVNTTSGGTDRDNSALYWGIGIAILVVIGIIYAVSSTNQRTGSAVGTGTSVTSPMSTGSSDAPAAGSTRTGETIGAFGTGTTNTGTSNTNSGMGTTNSDTDAARARGATGNERPNPEAAGVGTEKAPGGK